MELGLSGKVAVVTGASRGIGFAIASELGVEGCRLVVGSRGGEELEEAAERLRSSTGTEVVAEPVDVTDPDSIARFAKVAAEAFDGVDVLVNNAGRSYPGRFDKLTDQDFIDDYAVKGLSHIRVSKAVLPLLRARGGGRIININSIHGKTADPRFFTSSVNRAASIAFARTLALELVPDNILVNSVNIGYVLTPQWANVHRRTRPDLDPDEFYRSIAEEDVPMGRMGTPEEVAGVVAFLASNRATFLTGGSFDVGGGMN